MTSRRRVTGLLTSTLAAALTVGGLGAAVSAQDATPTAGMAQPRPAHIHEGSCGEEELGGVVAPLTDLTRASGASIGNRGATVAESSYTSVPLTLDAILAADHAVNVHRSAEEIDDYIACGEIGGAVNANGSLIIGLKEQNGSGFTGIAFLAAGADGASTDVSVLIAEGLSDDGAMAMGAMDDESDSDGSTTVDDADDANGDADETATAEAEDDGSGDADATATAEADGDADATETAESEEDEG